MNLNLKKKVVKNSETPNKKIPKVVVGGSVGRKSMTKFAQKNFRLRFVGVAL